MPTAPKADQMENNLVELDRDDLSAMGNDKAKSETILKSASGSGVWDNLVAAVTAGPPPPPAIPEVQRYMPTLAIIKTGGNSIEKRSVKSNHNSTESPKNDSIKDKEDVMDDVATTVAATETTEPPKTDPTKTVDIINTTDPLPVEESTQEPVFKCLLMENKVDLSVEFPNLVLANDQARIIDIKKCSNSTDTMECRATRRSYSIIIKDTILKVSKFHIIPDYETTGCTAFNTLSP